MFTDDSKFQCLICHQKIRQSTFLLSYFMNPYICLNCFEQLHILLKKKMRNKIEILTLYEYNDYFRSLLYQYKGNYDYELRMVFLVPFIPLLKRRYRSYKIVPAPSSDHSNIERGFKPMYEIAKTSGLEVIDCLYKTDEYKQSEQRYANRIQVKDHIRLYPIDLSHDKILFLDDVATSYHTMDTCISLLLKCHPKKIKVLLLSQRVQKKNKKVLI